MDADEEREPRPSSPLRDAVRRRFLSPPWGYETGCNLTLRAFRKTSESPLLPPLLSILGCMDCQCVTLFFFLVPFPPQTAALMSLTLT